MRTVDRGYRDVIKRQGNTKDEAVECVVVQFLGSTTEGCQV
jgi:hypothetical protein